MKKAVSFVLVLCLALGLCACGEEIPEPYHFTSDEEFTNHVEREAWVAEATYGDTTYYRIRLFSEEEGERYCVAYDLKAEKNETYEQMITRMLNEMKEDGANTAMDIQDVYTFIVAIRDHFDLCSVYDNLQYDWENGLVKNDKNTWDFSNGTTMTNHNEIYEKDDDLWKLNTAFVTAYGTFAEAQKKAFLDKYPNLASYRDVAYDFYNYIGQDFQLEGSVELDDYYNYEYRGLEAVYFCMCVTPTGGSFTDRWYIYAERSEFSNLFETLKSGNLSKATFVCQALFPDAGMNRMANLVDCYVG